MTTFFQDAVALITGGGRGIGKACALRFAELGADVAIVSRTPAELERTRQEIEQRTGRRVLAFAGDVSAEASVVELFRRARTELGPVKFLVNNAATFHVAAVTELGVEAFDEVMAVNARGTFLCSRELLRHPVDGGAIVNISSLGGVRRTEKFPGLAAYVASKFAVVGLTEALAVESIKLGVRTNAIAPGAVNTEMLRQVAPHLGTSTQPEDIANSVVMLCDGNLSRRINGSLLEIYSNESRP
jgi:NAD(P)-dependent dehydrogenase (short-subunit alcohol dehydrogenase family)